ncbi:MAG: helix-turn-helix domain-containing protein [Carnobacterium maltaromaticum]
MDELSYLDYLLFSFFSTSEPRKAMTVFHIISGKRTASILYQAEIYRLSAYFSLFNKLKKENYQHSLKKGIALKILKKEENDYYCLTEMGQKEITVYFEKQYYPTKLNFLQNSRWIHVYWRRLVFVSQVLSEIRYKNQSYIPIEKEWSLQVWVKKWLKSKSESREELAEAFGIEWLQLARNQSKISAEIMIGFLTGHDYYGQTTMQLATAFLKEAVEVRIILLDGLSKLIHEVTEQPETFPIFFSIFTDLLETHGAVSQSVRQTQKNLMEGLDLIEIAKIRQLKLSTVSEHVIELSLIDKKFNVHSLIKEQPFLEVKQQLENQPMSSFSDIKEFFPEVPFYVYRLMQIERWREKNAN